MQSIVITRKLQLPSLERWFPFQCQVEVYEHSIINFAISVPEVPKNLFSSETNRFSLQKFNTEIRTI